MKKNEIINQIRNLLDQLEADSTGLMVNEKSMTKSKLQKAAGCIGAIQNLIEESFFETQKSVSEVLEKLKIEGLPYSKELVSMNLLNLVKPPRRTLRRISEGKQWRYIIRK